MGVGAALPIPQLAVLGAFVTGPALVLGLFCVWSLKHISPLTFPGWPTVRGVSLRRTAYNVSLWVVLLIILVGFLLEIGAGLVRDLTKSPSALVTGSAAVGTAAWPPGALGTGRPFHSHA
ncbi:MAG TPA: hypothetical protein VFI15_02130 [Candidatus Limnocylindrales bacterium]|nr:hypothetical protein [Candidatus Limnocylindrales bacterium]